MKYTLFLVTLSLLLLFHSCTSQNTTSIWVDALEGFDTSDCGTNSTYSCKTLNWTLTRGIDITKEENNTALIVYVQGYIANEYIHFLVEYPIVEVTIICYNNSRFFIAESNITIISQLVKIVDVDITTSYIAVSGGIFEGVIFRDSEVQGVSRIVDGVDIHSSVNVSSSSFFNTISYYQNVDVENCIFQNSPVEVFNDACYVRNSEFSLTTTKSALIVQKCTVESSNFTQNNALNGGAIYAKTHLIVSHSNLAANEATIRGGAIYAERQLFLYNSIVDSNDAETGGGVYINGIGGGGRTEFLCDSSSFSRNTAAEGGGAFASNLILFYGDNCTFSDNSASVKGGGLYALRLTGSLIGASVVDNNASPDGGGVYLDTCSDFDITASFVNNTAMHEGSSLYALFTSQLRLDTVTFVAEDNDNGLAANHATVIVLYNSSDSLAHWRQVSFGAGSSLDHSFYCNDCEDDLCPATSSCLDCSQGCLSFAAHDVCYESQCYGSSTCLSVENQKPKCECPKEWDGVLCDHHTPSPTPDPKSDGLPGWAWILIGVGILCAITIVVAVVIHVRNRSRGEYEKI